MSGNARRLAEAANQIINSQPVTEAYKAGDTVKVPHKGKMVKGKIVRYDDGGTDKARQSGGGYVVDVGEPASILVPANKVVKEAANQIDEISKATKDAYVAKRGSQLSSMLSGHTKGKQLTGKQQANAVKGIKQATGVKEAIDAAKQAEIDAKIRKSNAAEAIEKIKRILNDHDKQERAMIISGIKSIKESAEQIAKMDIKEETKIKEAIEDDDEAYDPKDVEAVVKVCKALQSKGVGGKSAFKNFAHFKLLWQAWYELGKMKTADKKGNLGYLAGIDPFKDQGFKAAKRAGCAGAWNALIGGPGFYAAFLDWADGEVEGRYIKPVNTIQKSVLDMFWGLYRD